MSSIVICFTNFLKLGGVLEIVLHFLPQLQIFMYKKSFETEYIMKNNLRIMIKI